MGLSVQRGGFTKVGSLIVDVVDLLRNNGFTVSYPTAWIAPVGTALSKFNVTLEASGAVDPLNAANVAVKQPWRIKFDVLDDNTVSVILGTPLQLPDDGSHAFVTASDGAKSDVMGAIGAQQTDGVFDKTIPSMGFINRSERVKTFGAGYPMSYLLTITDRGVFLGVWEDVGSAQSGNYFSWFLVQRPVARDTGAVVTTGKTPVFCLNGVNNKYWRFTVREADVLRPSIRVAADVDSADSEAVINSKEQVSLTEDNKYVVTFPARLNTARYRYTHELDMIGTTSADVISQELDVPISVYGESTPRVYKALHANGLNNTGMRVLVLTNGGGANPLA